MNPDRVWDHTWRNLLHSLLLLGGMVVLLWWLAGVLFDLPAVLLAVMAGLALFTLNGVSPRWVLRMHRARVLSPHQAPGLTQLVRHLAARAELRHSPDLYLVPSPALNAFAVGNAEGSAIGVTRGLLQHLDQRELAGVLAHEISHIRHRDLWVMGLARWIGQMTRSLSWLGQLMLLLSVPAVLVGSYQVPWAAVVLLIAAPTLSSLLLLALSRTREFEADLGAARLTGDPVGLASALQRLDAQQGGWWRWLLPVPRPTRSSFLDSHPATNERVQRLRSLVDRQAARTAQPIRGAYQQAPRQPPVRVPVRLIDRGPAAHRLAASAAPWRGGSRPYRDPTATRSRSFFLAK